MAKPLIVDPTTSVPAELSTGDLTLPADPTTALGAATKQSVDKKPDIATIWVLA